MMFTAEAVKAYLSELEQKERSKNTIVAYQADIKTAMEYLEGKEITMELLKEYKDFLTTKAKGGKGGYKPATCNRKLKMVNNILKANGAKLFINPVKVQARLTIENFLSESDYKRLLSWSEKLGDSQSGLIMKSLVSTGIRIGELQFLTVEAVQAKVMEIDHKGTIRKVPLIGELRKELTAYYKARNIKNGSIFISRHGNPLSTEYVSRKLKRIAGRAKVKLLKVHPHNFRHLFAVHYLQGDGQLQELKDILGHKSLDTTVIYTRMSEKEIAKKMEANSLVTKTARSKGKPRKK